MTRLTDAGITKAGSESPSDPASTAGRTAARSRPPALEVSGISKTFTRGRSRTRVLDNVSLTVEPQEFVSILGPSGCGKSTLF
ncbi:ATP-binding cassette domain-containing protein, partial [Paenibacillus ihuae]|uniref:ATP-binding cassette domain-containing protein n=1 Tax=Paenibacillus ihuae TaxID=1232431 RepID=UPI0011DCE0A7